MGIRDEYEKEVESLHEKMEETIPEGEVSSLKKSMDDVLPIVLLLLFFVLVFNFVAPVSQRMAAWVTYANYLVIAYFASRLAVEYRLSDPGEQFVRNHLLDIAMIVPAFSILEEVKLISALREAGAARLAPEFLTGSAFARTGVAAKMTKISRILKRSL